MFRIRQRHDSASSPSSPHQPPLATVSVARYLLVYLLLMTFAMPRSRPPTGGGGIEAASIKCSRTPQGHGATKSPSDGRFHVRISENTVKYTPGQTYTSK